MPGHAATIPPARAQPRNAFMTFSSSGACRGAHAVTYFTLNPWLKRRPEYLGRVKWRSIAALTA